MPFQPGNQLAKNRTSPKEFANALRLAIKDTDGDKLKLRLVAEALIEKALEGDVPAIREIADRLDGKVPQGVAVDGDGEGGPVELVVRWSRPDEMS